MRAFHPYGITSNQQTLPYHQFPEIQSYKVQQFPEDYGLRKMPDVESNKMLRKIPDVESNKIQRLPATHSAKRNLS